MWASSGRVGCRKGERRDIDVTAGRAGVSVSTLLDDAGASFHVIRVVSRRKGVMGPSLVPSLSSRRLIRFVASVM